MAPLPISLLLPAKEPARSHRPLAIAAIILGLCTAALATLQLQMSRRTTPLLSKQLVLPARDRAPLVRLQPREAELMSISSQLETEEQTSPLAADTLVRRKTILPARPSARSSPPPADEAPDAAPVCDEVLCLVEPDAECCELAGVFEPEEGSGEVLPVRHTRQQVMARMRSINGRVESCFDRAGHRGVATVHFVIHRSGKVEDVSVSASPELQACIAPLVDALEFQPAQNQLTMAYPYVFR
jgi:hypothetical protein